MPRLSSAKELLCHQRVNNSNKSSNNINNNTNNICCQGDANGHLQTIPASLAHAFMRSAVPFAHVPSLNRGQPDNNMTQWSLASSHLSYGGGAAAAVGSSGGCRGGGGKSTGSRGNRLFNRRVFP